MCGRELFPHEYEVDASRANKEQQKIEECIAVSPHVKALAPPAPADGSSTISERGDRTRKVGSSETGVFGISEFTWTENARKWRVRGLRADRPQLGQSSDAAGLQSRFREAMEECRVIRPELLSAARQGKIRLPFELSFRMRF